MLRLENRSAWDAVSTFRDDVRFRLCTRIARDELGRVAQFARAAPGAVLLLFGMEERGGNSARAAEEAWRAVISGQRLDTLLDRAILTWWHNPPAPTATRKVTLDCIGDWLIIQKLMLDAMPAGGAARESPIRPSASAAASHT